MWKFESENGLSGETTITDPLIADEKIATIRAAKELLEKGTKQKRIKIEIARVENLEMYPAHSVIVVRGVKWLIEKISYQLDKVVIEGVRYEY